MRFSFFLASAVFVASVSAHAQSSWNLASSIGPSPRIGHAMGFDIARGRAVCFGGTFFSPTGGSGFLGDTWEWDGVNWVPQIFATGPGARTGAHIVYDSLRSRILLLGGESNSPYGGPPIQHGEVWSWTGSTWQLVNSSAPGSSGGGCACFDSARDRLFWLPANAAHPHEWDGASWQQIITSGAPPARARAAIAFDSVRGRVVMHGGVNSNSGAPLDDTWEWSGSSWQYKGQLSNSTWPGRYLQSMYFDSLRQRVVMFGGYIIVPNGPYSTGPQPTSIEWEWGGASWVYAGAAPQGVAGAGCAFDVARNVTWVFGGVDVSGNGIIGTWQRAGAGSGSPYGVGCGAPLLALSQLIAAQPRLGTTAVAQVGSIPSSVAVMALGFSKQAYGPFPLPLVLNGLGMPGCQLLHSADVFGESLAFISPATATYSLAIPNASALVGLHVYLQAFAVAPGVNPREIIASNGLDWNIGS